MSKNITTRRSFIKKVFASVSGGIALVSAGKLFGQSQQSATAESLRTDSQGYQETEHIRSYYNSARH